MLKDLVLKNRSYRGFDENRKVTKEELLEMVDLARLSASTANMQPLKYFLAWEEADVATIQSYTHWAAALKEELPHVGKYPTAFIVICHDRSIAHSSQAYLRDVGIAAQTILLCATQMGLGGCMIGSFDKKAVTNIIGSCDDFEPQLVIAIGKPDETVILTDVQKDKSTRYYRDAQDRHYVPKRSLEDCLIRKE